MSRRKRPRYAWQVRANARLVCVLGAMCCLGACDLRQNAVVTFSVWYACPAERITVSAKAIHPPADVAADPERLALWRRMRQDEHLVYFGVDGCGRSEVFACSNNGWCKRYFEPAEHP